MKNNIESFRKKIDLIDNQIIDLLARRLAIVKKLGRWKKQRDLPSLDKTRWQEVLVSRMKKAKKLGISAKLVKKIYETIHNEALKIEEIS